MISNPTPNPERRLDTRLLRLLAKDSALAGVSELLSRAFLFVVNLIVSHLLVDRAAYGEFAAVSWLAATVFAFTSMGVATTGVRVIAAAGEDRQATGRAVRSALLLIAALAAVAGIGVALAAPWIVAALEAPVPVESVRLAALLIMVQVLLSGGEAAVRGLGRFRALAWSAVIAVGLSLVPAYLLVAAHGVTGGILALTLCYALQTAILLYAVGDQLRSLRMMRWAELRRFVGGLAIPHWVSGAGFAIGMMIPPMMLLQDPRGLANIGAWNASTQLRILVTFLPTVMAVTAVPHLTALVRGGELTARAIGSFIGPMLVATVVPLLVTVWLAADLLGLYGISFRADASLLVLVASFTAVQVIGNGFSSILLAAGRVWAPAVFQSVWAVGILFAAAPVISAGGSSGLAQLYLVSALPVTLFGGWWSWRARQPG
ncbi:MAG: hypothetical protein GY944_11805 [bacterium]|nr:hypothetical protein [bacterium]